MEESKEEYDVICNICGEEFYETDEQIKSQICHICTLPDEMIKASKGVK